MTTTPTTGGASTCATPNALRPENIPPELKAIPQWVLWRYSERGGKRTKPPLQANGEAAKVNDPSTWTTYDAATQAYQSGKWGGIGFVLTKDDDFAGIDLDHCLRPDGGLAPWAREIVDAVPSYWEVSPSGEGLRCWLKGQLPQGGRRKGGVEMYDDSRYLTLTGRVFSEHRSVSECTAELAAVYAKVFGKENDKAPSSPPVDAAVPPPRHLSDTELLADIRCSKQSARFEELYSGRGGEDASANDLSLCNILAFWTARDATRMDRIFRNSELMRDKWDEKHSADGRTYGQMTIAKAIAGCKDVYTGRRSEGHSDIPAGGLIPEIEERPCFKVFDDWVDEGGKKWKPGVYWFSYAQKGEVITQVNTWICSPLYIDAITHDGAENNFGRMLRFRNANGRWRKWAMPMELLAGLGNEVRAELLAMGVEITPDRNARLHLEKYFQQNTPNRRVRAAMQVGWCGDSFVLPDTVIGPGTSDVIFQNGERGIDEYTLGGTLEGWQKEVAALAVGNPIMAFTISCAFAGPLLERCHAESGGIHLVGDSSSGKTTIIDAARSVCGGASYRRSWNATANGMEGAAALFNDGLLALDEISECEPREIGKIIYAIGNGVGKQRASRTGTARSLTRWRCFVISSGERTVATSMEAGGFKAKAGQSIRLLDIPARQQYGAFDNLHNMMNGATFADAIKKGASTHYGHPLRRFLEKLTQDDTNFGERLAKLKALPNFLVDGEGQEKRAASRFAVVALAGELATQYGITGWGKGAATEAALTCFHRWREERGSGMNDERRRICEQVERFIDRHGDSRFSNVDGSAEVRDRAGWWRSTPDTRGFPKGDDRSDLAVRDQEDWGHSSPDYVIREYLFTCDGMREALKGFDFAPALAVLRKEGVLGERSGGKSSLVMRIGHRRVRVYLIQTSGLGGE